MGADNLFSKRLSSTDKTRAAAAMMRDLTGEPIDVQEQVGTLPLYAVVTGRTDAEAQRLADDVIAKADRSAIGNILGSAALDTNEGGSSSHLQAALDLPNFGSLGGPLLLENDRFPAATVQALQALGHTVDAVDMTSGAQALVRRGGRWLGGADPRREGIVSGD